MRIVLMGPEVSVYNKIANGMSEGGWNVLLNEENLNSEELAIARDLENLGITEFDEYNNVSINKYCKYQVDFVVSEV